ncbi:MAG: glycine cleavage system protein H [Acidobacteriota bacterium]
MIPHDILTLYSAKMIEYGIAILFLLVFIPFWNYVQGPSAVAVPVQARVRQAAAAGAQWFQVPLDRLFHRGHAWARPEADGLVTVGLDGFAANLIGPLAAVGLPHVGAAVGQGERAWRLIAEDGRAVEMLSPVDGVIADINRDLVSAPDAAQTDPYGAGWLLRIRPDRLRANSTNLLSGPAARRWMDEAVAGLQQACSPELGALAQDGGVPVSGMARAIDPEHWDRIARTHLLTDEKEAAHV